jgi:hypothetical protein
MAYREQSFQTDHDKHYGPEVRENVAEIYRNDIGLIEQKYDAYRNKHQSADRLAPKAVSHSEFLQAVGSPPFLRTFIVCDFRLETKSRRIDSYSVSGLRRKPAGMRKALGANAK